MNVPIAIAKNTEVIIPNRYDANALKYEAGFFLSKNCPIAQLQYAIPTIAAICIRSKFVNP